MFASVLIANRGEIACRIARTARRLGLRTIAVYSEADARTPHVRLCDEAHLIGPPPARDSYLSIERVIAAARAARAECIHPGYGFLSENAEFAEACAAADIAFVGPPADAIRAMGLKDRAKALMEKAGVPVVPGYHGNRQDAKFLKEKAYELGYPVLIKAVAGGGGRGLRRVDKHAEFEAALESAQREAQAAFGDARVLVERYVAAPRHIEFQVFADRHGNVIHLNERDCSLQRRHQKVIEEAPAPGMTPPLRAQVGAAAVEAAKAVGYVGAGTVEFIADASKGLRAERFWFMEMNTRLQVEHPVTEAITGLDLVEWQFRVATGERLPLAQPAVPLDGHAVEARVYAEDPANGFLPSTGTIVALALPDDVRVDAGVEASGAVSPYYDPMIAKLIAHAATRDAAIERLAQALDRTLVAGPRSNVAFLAALCRAPEFRDGAVDTGFIARNLAALGAVPQPPDRAAVARGAAHLLAREAEELFGRSGEEPTEPDSPWAARDGFQLGGARAIVRAIVADGELRDATVHYGAAGMQVEVEGSAPAEDALVFDGDAEAYVLRNGRQTRVRLRDFAAAAGEAGAGDGLVSAPMHGKVLEILVTMGEHVAKGQRLATIEAMKMEHTLTAPCDGIVAEIAVAKDHQVVEGAKIMLIEPAPAALD
jgi:3-methylcrotonyl-CoA carboxylase alpha subunit